MVVGLGNRKDAYFAERLHADGVEVFGGTVERVREVCSLGASTALVTSSKHGREVIALAGLGDIFDARLDGNDIETLGLKGQAESGSLPGGGVPARRPAGVRGRRRGRNLRGPGGARRGFRAGDRGQSRGQPRGPRAERGDVVDAALADTPRLRKHHGKRVFEIRPRIDWDKGRAVLWLLEALGLEGEEGLPLYLGDDVTDEDAFRALAGRGVGVLVAEETRASAAGYRLRDPDEVREFLVGLASRLEEVRE